MVTSTCPNFMFLCAWVNNSSSRPLRRPRRSNRTTQQTPNASGAGKQRVEPAPSIPPQPSGPSTSEDVERNKRRPGRPRGSKNRRIRGSGAERDASAASTTAAKRPTTTHGFYQYSAPPAPGEVHPHNQQYYEFQWRVLNLCAEFYGAAEELIVSSTGGELSVWVGANSSFARRKLHHHW